MVCCRKISRALAFVGFYTLAGAIAVSASAAPVCSQVLIKAPTDSEVSSTISSLAEMKMSLDILKTQKSSSQELRVLEQQYSIKLAELQKALSGKYSTKDIQEMLASDIAKVQELTRTEKQKESEVRQRQRLIQPNYKKTVELQLQVTGDDSFIAYVPEHNAVLYFSYFKNELRRKNIKDGSETAIFENKDQDQNGNFGHITANLLPDRKSLIITKINGEVWKLDLDTNVATPMKPTVAEYFGVTQIDPTGKVLFLINDTKVVAYNFKTQKQKIVAFNSLMDNPIPLNATSLLLQRRDGLFKFNINSLKETQITTEQKNGFHSLISDDGTKVAITYDKSVEIVDLTRTKKSNAPIPEYSNEFFSLHKIPNFDYIYAFHHNQYRQKSYGIFRTTDFETPVFTFTDYKDKSGFKDYGPLRFRFSADLHSVAVLYNDGDVKGRGTQIDIWELPE